MDASGLSSTVTLPIVQWLSSVVPCRPSLEVMVTRAMAIRRGESKIFGPQLRFRFILNRVGPPGQECPGDVYFLVYLAGPVPEKGVVYSCEVCDLAQI